ncbi:MAG: hypothetical protein ACRDYU_12080 [Actinomycetes bacterium]
MALTIHRPHLTLNTDGVPHPRENALAAVTVVFGLVSLVMTGWDELHAPGAWIGAIGAICGGYAQLISATTAERWVIVFGLGFSCVGVYLNLAHGGLY